jgi:hypothetical protein
MVTKGQLVIPTPDKLHGFVVNPVAKDIDHGWGRVQRYNPGGIAGFQRYFSEIPGSTSQIQDKRAWMYIQGSNRFPPPFNIHPQTH